MSKQPHRTVWYTVNIQCIPSLYQIVLPRRSTSLCSQPARLHKSHVDLLAIIKNIGGSDHILQQDASCSAVCLSSMADGGTVKNDSIMLLCNHKSFNSHPQMRSKLIGWNSVFLGSWSQGCSAYETRGLPAIILAFKPELTNAFKE